jgi:hypothetical protein
MKKKIIEGLNISEMFKMNSYECMNVLSSSKAPSSLHVNQYNAEIKNPITSIQQPTSVMFDKPKPL